jgi:hypothetical protein
LIGHSLGTAPIFAALANKKSYWKNDINLFIALAPVTNLYSSSNDLIHYAAENSAYIQSVLNFAGIYEFYSIANSVTTKYACRLLPSWCRYAREFLLTSNPELDDPERF